MDQSSGRLERVRDLLAGAPRAGRQDTDTGAVSGSRSHAARTITLRDDKPGQQRCFLGVARQRDRRER
jgi:hypothetical protein